MRPLSVNAVGTLTGAAAAIDELFRASGMEEYSQVPADEDWIIDWVATEMTANPGTWVLRAAGVEIANGFDITVTTLGVLDLNQVARLGVRIPGGTKLVWNHTGAGAATAIHVRIQGRRFRKGMAL